MKNIRSILVFLLAFAMLLTALPLSALAASDAVCVYVATNGSDTTGDGTISKPFATLDKARLYVRTLPKTAPITVYLRGGEYYLSASVNFTEQDSGTSACPITYQSYPGETAHLYGSRKPDAGKIADASNTAIGQRVIDATARQKLKVLDLSSYVSTIDPIYSAANSGATNMPVRVYCGDTALTLARYPDSGYLMPASINGLTMTVNAATKTRMQSWSDSSLSEIHLQGSLFEAYNSEAYLASEVKKSAGTLKITAAAHGFSRGLMANGVFYFFNLPEEISRPGECYIDRAARKIYFYPPDNFDAADMQISTVSTSLISLNKTTYVNFDGLDIAYTRRNAFDLRPAEHITIKNCTIRHNSWNAMTIYGNHITIDGCCIFDTYTGGIALNDADCATFNNSQAYASPQNYIRNLQNGYNSVTNCSIGDVNGAGATYNAAIGVSSFGAHIAHNEIYNCVHQAISINSNDIIIEYNDIHDCVTDSSDMGAIYYGRDPLRLGNIIRYNYIHDIGNLYYLNQNGQFAIYVDDGSSGASIYGNVFRNAAGPNGRERGAVHLNGSQFSHIEKNIFIDTDSPAFFTGWGMKSTVKQEQTLWYVWLYNNWIFGHSGIGSLTSNGLLTAGGQGYEVNNEVFNKWKSHYAGTIWEDIFDYFHDEKDWNGVSDTTILARFKAGEIDPPGLSNTLTDNAFVSVTSDTEEKINNPSYTGASDHFTYYNNYSTKDQSIFVNAAAGDYSLTAAGLAAIKATATDFADIPFNEIGLGSSYDPPVKPGDEPGENDPIIPDGTTVFYVSATGSDSNSGLSSDKPLLTVAEANRKVAAYLSAHPNAEVQVVIPDSYYTLLDVTAKGTAPEKLTAAQQQVVEQYLPGIVLWGDSLTGGVAGTDFHGQSTWNPFANELTRMIASNMIPGYNVPDRRTNCAVGGENITTITARANALTIRLNNAVDIPASGKVSGLSMTVPERGSERFSPLVQSTTYYPGKQQVLIGGIEGTLERLDGVYIFTRKTPGDAVTIPAGAEVTFLSGNLRDNSNYIPIIYMGQNDGNNINIDNLIDDIQRILNKYPMYRNNDRYLLLTPHFAHNTMGVATAIRVENALIEEFGEEHVIAVRPYLTTMGMYEQERLDGGYTLTADDYKNAALGMIPDCLYTNDYIHLTANAQTLTARLIYQRMETLGYFDEVKAALSGNPIVHTHTLSQVAAVSATCTETGIAAHYHCLSCGKNYSDNTAAHELSTVVTPALGHNYVESICSRCGAHEPSFVSYRAGQFYDLFGYNGQNAAADPNKDGWGYGYGGDQHGSVDIYPVTKRAAISSSDSSFLDRFNTAGAPVQMVYAENVKFDDRATGYSGITYLTTSATGRGYITYRISAADQSKLDSLDYMMFGCIGLDGSASSVNVYYSTSAPTGSMSTYLSTAVKSRTIAANSAGYYGPISAEGKADGTISNLSGDDIYVTFELDPKSAGGGCLRFTGAAFDVTMTASHVHEGTPVEAPATCTTPGTQTYYFCEGCGGYFEDVDCTVEIADIDAWCAAHPLPTTAHPTEHTQSVDADCLNPGNIEYWYCTVCHKYFSDVACENEITAADTEIGALGHDMNAEGWCNRCSQADSIEHIWRLGNNIALEDSILLRYFLVFDEWTLGQIAKGNISVDITVDRVDGKPQSITYDSAALDFSSLRSTQKYKDGKNYLTYVFSLPTAAKQMTDIMTLTVTQKSTGRQLFVYNYSIQEYCYHKLESTVPGLAYLVGKVAAYGREAQIYAGYRLDHYADEWDKLNEYNEMNTK